MQEFVIHQNIERKLQCIFIGTLGMKERKEKQIFFGKKEYVNVNDISFMFTLYFLFRKKLVILLSLFQKRNKLPKSNM